MSTVPPAAALPLALPLLLLLPLLLQPAAAKAIAAKAAIAVVRLIVFLSLFELVPLSWSAPSGPFRAHGPATTGSWPVRRRPATATASPLGVDSGRGSGPVERRRSSRTESLPDSGLASTKRR